jgi:hypothetical protein
MTNGVEAADNRAHTFRDLVGHKSRFEIRPGRQHTAGRNMIEAQTHINKLVVR